MAEKPTWVPENDQERLASYTVYDQIYWNHTNAFKLAMRGTNDRPVLVPSARMVVDETSHYLLKGLVVETDDPEDDFGQWLNNFLKRERFYSRFHENKHSGCIKGDWLFHITADPEKPEGSRVSLTTIDPGTYFPIYNDDDPDDLLGIDLIEQMVSPEDDKQRVKRLRYTYVWVNGIRRVLREEVILEMEGWFNGEAAKVFQKVLPEELLPENITTIPVYHFRNIGSQGDPFGSSEIRGFETLITAINQTVSDEEIALALEGIGVWVTDAPRPRDQAGNEVAWSVGPGEVLEIPLTSQFKRAEGIRSIEPLLNHIKMLQDNLFKGSHTFDAQNIDVQVAESGVALAIKFLPTLAKIEMRDQEGLAILENMFFDLMGWFKDYEGQDFMDKTLSLILGQKLPTNAKAKLNELNNMIDRGLISRKYYREEMARHMGYRFPTTIEADILAEAKIQAEINQLKSPIPEGEPNNQDKPNESAGTEATQDAEEQQSN
jgi:hypothetical protein